MGSTSTTKVRPSHLQSRLPAAAQSDEPPPNRFSKLLVQSIHTSVVTDALTLKAKGNNILSHLFKKASENSMTQNLHDTDP
jgi:hypothetical protein